MITIHIMGAQVIRFDLIFYSVHVRFESPQYGSIRTMSCPGSASRCIFCIKVSVPCLFRAPPFGHSCAQARLTVMIKPLLSTRKHYVASLLPTTTHMKNTHSLTSRVPGPDRSGSKWSRVQNRPGPKYPIVSLMSAS